MTLTEEQREQIRRNRERALAIQKERKLKEAQEQEKQRTTTAPSPLSSPSNQSWTGIIKRKLPNQDPEETTSRIHSNPKKLRLEQETTTAVSSSTSSPTKDKQNNDQEQDEDEELEDFEVGASEWINKTEAMQKYCLPIGTLNVCKCVTRDNPHHASWSPMKLYSRKDIRRRAHKRWGGIAGLQKEREKRAQRRLEKDLKLAKKVFET